MLPAAQTECWLLLCFATLALYFLCQPADQVGFLAQQIAEFLALGLVASTACKPLKLGLHVISRGDLRVTDDLRLEALEESHQCRELTLHHSQNERRSHLLQKNFSLFARR